MAMMTPGKVAELLNEPGCEHNHHKHNHNGDKKQKGCQQQATPGAAQGGCAFDGASIALVPITDAAHLVHGPLGCSGNSWGTRGSLSSEAHLYKMGFTTDMSENDIIMGGEKKLLKAIAELKKRYQPPAVFVYSTCVTSLIGDDLETVCKIATKKLELPVIPVNSPGFIGSKNLGNRVSAEALLDHVVGTSEPEFTTPYDINLIGEYNIAGEMWAMLPLFEKLGIRVLSKITGDATYKEICYAHRAKLNVMICSKAMINMARKMEERYGIPYIEESFYGVADINHCLRNIAAKIGDADLQERTEKLIAEETAVLQEILEPYRQRLKGKRVVLYTGGVKSWSIISAAQDLGMDVVATSTKKSTEEDKAKIKELLGKDGILLEKGNAEILLKVIADTKADMLIAGGRNQYTALKARIPFLHINQERHHPYAGYHGTIEMAKELDEALHSPVWEQVRQPVPWLGECQIDDVSEIETLPSLGNIPPATVSFPKKSLSTNPLKLSQPLGASLAYLGIKGMMPLFHGTQGCTAFAKVLLVNHFHEAIPLSTTAMTEVTTILGGEDNIETAILNQIEKSKPEVIGLLSTGLTETRGDDVERILKKFREEHPELDELPILNVSSPDYKGSAQDGFAATVERIVAYDYGEAIPTEKPFVTILAGSCLAPGDVQEVRDIVESFGLTPIVVPDLSQSLDGHLVDDNYSATSSGGTTIEELRNLSQSSFTLVIGESLRNAANILQEKFGTQYQVFPRLTGLGAVDSFILKLSQLVVSRTDPHLDKGCEVPQKYQRQRRQLQDAMLDTHFYFGHKQISIALEPDLLWATSWFLREMGADIHAAVTTTRSPLLEKLPTENVIIGDLGDLEEVATGSDLLITNSHGKLISEKLGLALYRMGMPIHDRLGNGQRCNVGYRGTMNLLFDIGNIFLEQEESKIHTNDYSLLSR
ncbi:MAG: bifunctional nitrogenase iron-molybdenum cofactor biosynthesis protein NifEN [Okeania sp. SIO2C9]|nr:bifunctional nitrogenase iron-molybdenum cofactor biosynthesis protein NifEN [Okeania sp. SIO2C9]